MTNDSGTRIPPQGNISKHTLTGASRCVHHSSVALRCFPRIRVLALENLSDSFTAQHKVLSGYNYGYCYFIVYICVTDIYTILFQGRTNLENKMKINLK